MALVTRPTALLEAVSNPWLLYQFVMLLAALSVTFVRRPTWL